MSIRILIVEQAALARKIACQIDESMESELAPKEMELQRERIENLVDILLVIEKTAAMIKENTSFQ